MPCAGVCAVPGNLLSRIYQLHVATVSLKRRRWVAQLIVNVSLLAWCSLTAISMSAPYIHPVVTDIAVSSSALTGDKSAPTLDSQTWHRVGKELYLHTSLQEAWIYAAFADEENIAPDSLVVVAVQIGEDPSEYAASAHP